MNQESHCVSCGSVKYASNPDSIQSNKCVSCRFYSYDAERQQYVCDIKGCVEHCCFVEYDWRKHGNF